MQHAHLQFAFCILKFLPAMVLVLAGTLSGVRLAGADEPAPTCARPLSAEVGTRQLLFSRDGKTLLSLATDSSQLWEVRTGKLLRKYDDFPPRRFGELPLALPFEVSPDARLVALGGLEDRDLHIREVATGKEVSRLKGRVEEEMLNVSMSFSPDGRLLALGGYPGNIHVWDTATGKELHLLRWRNLDHSALIFSPDNKVLAAGSKDGQIGLWEISSGKQLRRLKAYKEYHEVDKLAFSADGKILASGASNAAFRLWEVATGKQLLEIPREEYVFNVSFSPDSRLLASWGADNVIRLRELSRGKQRRLEGHSEMITSVVFSPDGKSLASAGRDQTHRLWDVDTGKQRFSHRRAEIVQFHGFLAGWQDSGFGAGAGGQNSVLGPG
jgi:WD40 repeat protein